MPKCCECGERCTDKYTENGRPICLPCAVERVTIEVVTDIDRRSMETKRTK